MTLPDILPSGTTWLDLATLVVAGLALVLTLRRDRRQSLRRVSIEVALLDPVLPTGRTLAVIFTNTGVQPLSIVGAGFARAKRGPSREYVRWNTRNMRRSGPGPFEFTYDSALPQALVPGGVPYGITTDLRRVKTEFYPEMPEWVFALDEHGKRWWCAIPEPVQSALRGAARFAPGPDDEYGHRTEIIVDDAGKPLTG